MPVAGVPTALGENLILIGLSNLDADVDRNRDLMRNRKWIDLPIRFASGQRAILSFEKGVAGEQVLNEAFHQWSAAIAVPSPIGALERNETAPPSSSLDSLGIRGVGPTFGAPGAWGNNLDTRGRGATSR